LQRTQLRISFADALDLLALALLLALAPLQLLRQRVILRRLALAPPQRRLGVSLHL
jgi:hypothetical protein